MEEQDEVFDSFKKIYFDVTKRSTKGKTKEEIAKYFLDYYGLELIFSDDGLMLSSEDYDDSFSTLYEDLTGKSSYLMPRGEVYDYFKDKYEFEIEVPEAEDDFESDSMQDQSQDEFEVEELSQIFDEFGISTVEELAAYIKDLEKDSKELWGLINKYGADSAEDLDKMLENSIENQKQ